MHRYLACVAVAALAATGCGGPRQAAPAGGSPRGAAYGAASQGAARPPTAPLRAAAAAPSVAAPRAAAAVLEQRLAYGESKDSNLMGFVALPKDAAEPLPGLILIHERFGLTDGVKETARRLAAFGYVVLAVDLYGGRVGTDAASAAALAQRVTADPAAARRNLRQAYEFLERYAMAPRIGAIGWDFGGTWALETALLLPEELDAAVIYYGRVGAVDAERLAALDMPVLAFFGGLDPAVADNTVEGFGAALHKLGKPAEVKVYPAAQRAFADAGTRDYDPLAAADAWHKTVAFLAQALQKDAGPAPDAGP